MIYRKEPADGATGGASHAWWPPVPDLVIGPDAGRTAGCLRLAGRLRAHARLVFPQGTDARIQVHSPVDRVPSQHDARALAAALLSRYPRDVIHVPQLQRRAVGGAALESLGFERLPLHQLWLRRPLT